MIVFSFIQCLLDALAGVWHSLTVGESRSYFCLALIYGFKVSLLSAVRLASSAVLSSWRGFLSLTGWHLWPGQTWVGSWCPSTWTGCPMKRHSTSFLVYLFLTMLWWNKICLRFIPTESKVQDKCHVLAQDQKAASDTIPEDPIPRALCRVCSSGSVVHPKECWIQRWHIITLINIVAQVSGIVVQQCCQLCFNLIALAGWMVDAKSQWTRCSSWEPTLPWSVGPGFLGQSMVKIIRYVCCMSYSINHHKSVWFSQHYLTHCISLSGSAITKWKGTRRNGWRIAWLRARTYNRRCIS